MQFIKEQYYEAKSRVSYRCPGLFEQTPRSPARNFTVQPIFGSLTLISISCAVIFSLKTRIQILIINRDLDSVGAVGAAAPTDFEESSFCTRNFHTEVTLTTVC